MRRHPFCLLVNQAGDSLAFDGSAADRTHSCGCPKTWFALFGSRNVPPGDIAVKPLQGLLCWSFAVCRHASQGQHQASLQGHRLTEARSGSRCSDRHPALYSVMVFSPGLYYKTLRVTMSWAQQASQLRILTSKKAAPGSAHARSVTGSPQL